MNVLKYLFFTYEFLDKQDIVVIFPPEIEAQSTKEAKKVCKFIINAKLDIYLHVECINIYILFLNFFIE